MNNKNITSMEDLTIKQSRLEERRREVEQKARTICKELSELGALSGVVATVGLVLAHLVYEQDDRFREAAHGVGIMDILNEYVTELVTAWKRKEAEKASKPQEGREDDKA
jgi:hypothetical protein